MLTLYGHIINCFSAKCVNFSDFCLGAMQNIFIFAAHLHNVDVGKAP